MEENMEFSGVLFSDPRHFEIDYKINPYMKDVSINKKKAYQQWFNTIRKIRKYDTVSVVDFETFDPKKVPVSKLPDIVFCANHGVPVPKENEYILSNMKKDQREQEPQYFRNWAEHNGYNVRSIKKGVSFEGEGDAKWHPNRDILWVGYGYRTDEEAVDIIDNMIDSEVKRLTLNSEYYYHLDVCFEPLDKNTVVIIEEAFDQDDITKIKSEFRNVIKVPDEDLETMGGNCARLDDNNVIIDKQNNRTKSMIEQNGFNVITTDTSEFMKSGGSVDCMFVRVP